LYFSGKVSLFKQKTMRAIIQKLLGPLLSLVLLTLGNGLFNTFVSIRLEMEGAEIETIGMVTSALYAGILLGSIWIDRWIAKVGHVPALMLFAGASGVLVLAQGLWLEPIYWALLRFFGGVCMAGVFVAIESWFLLQSTKQTRSAVLSIYVAVFYTALSLGQLLIHGSTLDSFAPFLTVSFLCFASIIPLFFQKATPPKIEQTSRLSIWELMRRSPLGFSGGVISGVVLATVYGIVPAFAKEMGLTVSDVGNLMAVIIFGGLSLQWPIGYLADKTDRRSVLNGVAFASILCSLALAWIGPNSPFFWLLAWVFGGFAFGLYPLSMALACESVEEKEIVPATGGFVLAYGIGAVSGPLLAPLAMEGFGSSALFYFLAGIFCLLNAVGLYKRVVAPKKELEE
jgi:MFS family permease